MSEKAAVFRNLLAPILLALTGIVVTLLISAKVDHTQKSMVTAELRANQMHWVGLMEFSTEKEITLAQTLVSVFEDTPVIDQQAFNLLSENAIQLYPDLQALFWVPSISASQRTEVERVVALINPDFAFKDYAGPIGFVPARDRETYYPVVYWSGDELAESYLGWDLGGFGELGSMFSELASTEKKVRIRFVPTLEDLLGSGSERPVLQVLLAAQLNSSVFLPDGSLHSGPGYLVLLVDFSLLTSYFNDFSGGDKLNVAVTIGDGDAARVIFDVPPKSGVLDHEYATKVLFSNSGTSNWEVVLTPTDEFFYDRGIHGKYWVLATGLIISFILGFYLFALQRRTAVVRALVDRRTDELQKANQELDRLSRTDHLTGVANRRYFEEALEREWSRATRGKDPITLLMIDVDFFKAYNDRYGHVEGDYCLQQVARALSISVKRPADQVARFGGEEFVVLLPETDNAGLGLAERCRKKVEELQVEHLDSSISDYVTVSIGVVTLTPAGRQPSRALLKAADDALYRAKDEGRNRVREG